MYRAGGSSAPQGAGGAAGRRDTSHQQTGKSSPHPPTCLQREWHSTDTCSAGGHLGHPFFGTQGCNKCPAMTSIATFFPCCAGSCLVSCITESPAVAQHAEGCTRLLSLLQRNVFTLAGGHAINHRHHHGAPHSLWTSGPATKEILCQAGRHMQTHPLCNSQAGAFSWHVSSAAFPWLHIRSPGSTRAAQAAAAANLRLTGHLTRAASWVQAPVAVPQSADVGLLVEAEVGPLRQQLQQAHEQLAAQQLQIQVGVVTWALSASKLQLGLRPVPAHDLCVPKLSQ